MIICGIKPTHDGAIALIDNGNLIFSYEMEKLNNNQRHQEFCLSMDEINSILQSYGYNLSQIDKWAIDGWSDNFEKFTLKNIPFLYKGYEVDVELAEYGHLVKTESNILNHEHYRIEKTDFKYDSFLHVAGHVFGSYCSSPFSAKNEDSFVLVWDGGMPPQLFYYKYKHNIVMNLGPVMLLLGSIYVDFPHKFEPYCNLSKHVSIAGKYMAYIALGKERESIISAYRKIYDGLISEIDVDALRPIDIMNITDKFINASKDYCDVNRLEHRDMLTSLHKFLQNILLFNLRKMVSETKGFKKNLCFSGGSALNIKWNSAIRNNAIFEKIWVPPFPNDSGSSIGTACCSMIANSNIRELTWNVYSGPDFLGKNLEISGYNNSKCSLEELAEILHREDEPILFLDGRAELGPRALGNRSILAPATSLKMKASLNLIKQREDYRPIAPICLEEYAPIVFNPGTPDPFMLFEHMVKSEWVHKVPAIVHLDGSSRLQTVNESENKHIYNLLKHYNKISGIPLLCNTSANLKGSGFFPDLATAIKWGKIKYIWSDGVLHTASVAISEIS